MPHLNNNGAEIYYEVFGAGPPIIFAHGVGGNHASWFYQIAFFAQWHQVVVFDHRGFGKSSDPDRLGRSAFVDDLTRLIEALGHEKAVLVAQSMGGGTCTGYACAHPERVAALVLADTTVGIVEPESIREFMEQMRLRTENLSQVERVLGPVICRENPAMAVLYTQLAGFNSVDRRTLTGNFQLRSAEQLTATGVPLLFIVGGDDVLFPPRAVRAIHERVPGSRFVEIPGAGHSAYFEAPDAFNHQVRSFIAGLADNV